MPTEIKKKIDLEVVHVLFLDIVGYSKRLTNEQQTLIDQLNQAVRSSEEFQSAEAAARLIKIPTGDGMALVFYRSPAQPVECALEISRALKAFPDLQVRMGVHSGPVSAVTDLNNRTNAAGIGINVAQRVMDCGDAGHILLSQRVAEDLAQYGEWQPHLHDLGEVEVKHGARIHVFNLYNKELGNPKVPEKLQQSRGQRALAIAGRGDELWVAVIPFKTSGDAEMESFANGLGEEITTGLSRFRYLSIVASASAAQVRGEGGDERILGAKLGARYVLQGSIRRGGSGIRVSAQLVDTKTGSQLWAETYDRDLQSSTIFDVHDDIAAHIVATVADSYGVLVHSMRDAARLKDDADLTPAEWQFQYFAYREQITPSNHAALKRRLESSAEPGQRQSDQWACLAQIYVDEYAFGFPGTDATSLDRALTAARRAVELDRANQFAMVALAQTHFFRQDLAAFGPAAERAMVLNPLNTDALGILGLQIVHTGDFERGTAIVRRAMELNANHAGWMHFAPLWDHFHKGEYEEALQCANRVNVPGLFWPYLVMASACGHLGRHTEAAAAVRDLLALDPEFAAHARSNVGTWHFASGLMEPILDGLREAGLAIPENELSDSPRRGETHSAKADRAKSRSDPKTVDADEGFWVAVLPFKHGGGNSDLTALAEGLTEEIVTGLSRFSYLKVISRSSTSRYARESVDIRSAGKELGARYVMEGTVRQAGTKLRLAVQLVDTVSGAHLWAENYERAFSLEVAFELQDDLVPRIVSTVADRYGILSYNMSDLVRSKAPDKLTPYEALLRGIGYGYRLTPEEHAAARTCMERGVQQAPGYADGWAMLSLLYSDEYGFGFNEQPDPLGRALHAAQRATDAAPSNSLAQAALAKTLFFRKEFQAFRTAAEEAISINSMDGAQLATLGSILAYSGEWQRGCALIERAMQLNLRHPAWYRFPFFYNAYRQGDYAGALSVALKINLPGFFAVYEALAAVYGQLGQQEAASQSLREMLKLVPNFGEIGRALKSKWFDPELVEHLLDGLRRAGLEIRENRSPDSLGRSGTFRDHRQRLRNMEGVAPAKSIAVLPFVNMSGNKDDEYLSDGMTEELINALAKVPGLRVPGRTSCFAFKGKTEADIFRKVGDQLHVNAVLEGSVRKAGDKLRVTAQLINVSDGYHLWSKNYDGDVRDIFTFQSNVAQRVVEALQINLGAEEARALAKKPTENPEAHRLYLLGRYEFGKYGEAGWTNSIRYYEQALKLDPNYALAYCGLADTYAYMGGVVMPSKEAVVKEKEFAQKALELEPQLAEAHLSLAGALGGAFNWRNAQIEFERAIELNPNLAWAYEIYAWFLGGLGRLDEAIAKDKKAIELDPLNAFFQAALAYFLYHARRYDDAIAQIKKTLELDPNSTLARHLLGCCFLWKGDTAGAIAEFQRSKIMVTGAWYQGLLGYSYAISGDRLKAEQVLRELEEMAKQQYVSSTAFADIFLGLGEKEKALDWLEKSYQDQESACWYLKVDPIYDTVRDNPRFEALLKKLGLDK